MSDEFDYESMLDRAREALPEDQMVDDQRWSLPDLDLMYEGKTTVLKNFQDFVDATRRDPDHFLGHLLRDLGSAGAQDGRRLILKSVVSRDKLIDKLNDYVNTYVICGECGKPDTHLVKEGRTQVVECMACGGKRPVKVKKGVKARQKRNLVMVGDEMEVLVQDVGRMGDGLARVDRYMIYVPGVTKGSKVKVRVEKVSGTVVVARVIQT